MEFYPTSFEVTPETRSIKTSLQGKKTMLQDIACNIRGVHGHHGECKRFPPFAFELERDGEGFLLSWDGEITQDLSVVLEAQANGGQTIRGEVFLRLPAADAGPVVARPGANWTPTEKYQKLLEAGLSGEEALETISNKLGEEALNEVKASIKRGVV